MNTSSGTVAPQSLTKGLLKIRIIELLGTHSPERFPEGGFIQHNLQNVEAARTLITDFVNQNTPDWIKPESTLLQKAQQLKHDKTRGLLTHLVLRLEATDGEGREWKNPKEKENSNRTSTSPLRNPIINKEQTPILEQKLRNQVLTLIGEEGPHNGKTLRHDPAKLATAKETFYRLVNAACIASKVPSTVDQLKVLDLKGIQTLQLPHLATTIAYRFFSIDRAGNEHPTPLNRVQNERNAASSKVARHTGVSGGKNPRSLVRGAQFTWGDLNNLRNDLHVNLGPLLRAPQDGLIIVHSQPSLQKSREIVSSRVERLLEIPKEEVLPNLNPARIQVIVGRMNKVLIGKNDACLSALQFLEGVVARFGLIDSSGNEFPMKPCNYPAATVQWNFNPGVERAILNQPLSDDERRISKPSAQIQHWPLRSRSFEFDPREVGNFVVRHFRR